VFTDESGKEHTIHSSAGSNPPRFPVGSTVSVLYRVSDPTDATIEDRFILWIAPTIMIGLSLLFGTVGFLLKNRPKKKEIRYAA